MEGRPVRTWSSDYTAGQVAYLLENGHLLRAGQIAPEERLFSFPQAGGRVQEFSWDGELIWDFKFHTEKQIPHHDIARLPNGNVLLIVWEMKTVSETVAAGRSLDRIEGPWLVDSVIEIKPTGKTTGEVVWEWHVWDHLIVGHDTAGRNRKDVAAHPELIDINYGQTLAAEVARAEKSAAAEARRRDHLNTLQSIGYLGAPAAHGNPAILPDWTHINAISFNPELDQIMLTVRAFSEIWIIDHSTTTAEAKGHGGGRGGMGGDLLYRWGNPQAYRAGKKADRQLFAPHGAHWIPPGCPGAGHALIFNNGLGRPEGDFSSVDEIVLPVDAAGRYTRAPSSAFGPDRPVWSYAAPDKASFFARLLSSAQRLPNGNTLICHGETGAIFEVAPSKKIVWQHLPTKLLEPQPSGPAAAAARTAGEGKTDQLLSTRLRETLKFSAQQIKDVDELQNEIEVGLEKALSDDQRRILHQPGGARAGGFAAPGQIMSLSRQTLLRLTDVQKKMLADLQKRVDERLAQILDADQKSRFESLKRELRAAAWRPMAPAARQEPVPAARPRPPSSLPARTRFFEPYAMDRTSPVWPSRTGGRVANAPLARRWQRRATAGVTLPSIGRLRSQPLRAVMAFRENTEKRHADLDRSNSSVNCLPGSDFPCCIFSVCSVLSVVECLFWKLRPVPAEMAS